MDKKGELSKEQIVKGILFLVVLFVIIISIYSGAVADTLDIFKSKLFNPEKIKEKIIEWTIDEGAVEFDEQETMADEIYIIIKKAFDKMENDADCIEQLDFKEGYEDFVIEFETNNLKIYKKIGSRTGPKFNKPIGSQIIRSGNKEDLSGNLGRILYKNKAGSIYLVNSKDKNYFLLEYKQICSTGEYLKEITSNDLKNFNKIIISYNEEHPDVPEKYKEYYPGEYNYIEETTWWKRVGGTTSRDITQMVIYIKEAVDYKFKVNLYKIQKDTSTNVKG